MKMLEAIEQLKKMLDGEYQVKITSDTTINVSVKPVSR